MEVTADFIGNNSGRRVRCRIVFALLVFVSLLLPAQRVIAADSWLTSVTVDGQTIPISATINRVIPPSKADGVTLIDIVVSIYKKVGDDNYPAGDEDGNTQGLPGSEEQDTYEQIFQFMADAVYESTDGQHKLRNVCIYRQGRRSAASDVIWDPAGVPHATRNGVSGVGAHIYMYDNFNGHNHLVDKEGAGYGLGHNVGHYFYGLETEFPQEPGDVGVKFSMMNDPWAGRGGNYAWLNFSSAWQGDPPGDFENTRLTEHHRLFAESGWETIARNPASDSKPADLNASLKRRYFPDLAMVAPTGFEKPVVNLALGEPNDARSDLNIIWKTDLLVYQIVLDVSGSMSGEKIANATTAAKLLVGKAELEHTSIGIIHFNSTAAVLVPVTPIDDQATKDSIFAQIDTITAGGGTAIGDAAQLALDGLTALGTTEDTKIVFLLSDGQSNSGVDPLSVIPAYQAAKIPMFTFAYGVDADTVTLGQMATDTGGEQFISPTALADISLAFDRAFQSASGSQSIASGTETALGAKAAVMNSFFVDSTVGQLDVSVVHEGTAAATQITLRSPSGGIVTPSTVAESTSETLVLYSVELPLTGEWTLTVTPLTGSAVEFTYLASSFPDGRQYALSLESRGGSVLTYPAPMLVVASLEKETAINGASITGVLTRPDGLDYMVTLRDGGKGVDDTADDGRYSALIYYDESGLYRFEFGANNFTGTANLTYGGHGFPSASDDHAAHSPPDQPIGEYFQRESSLEVQVINAKSDDHGDSWLSATVVLADNSDMPGRTEKASDVDYFSFTAPQAVVALRIRVTALAGDFEPLVRVFDRDGTSLLEEGTFETSTGPNGYVNVYVNVAAGFTYYASVTNEARKDGLYQFSVGPGILSDRDLSPPRVVQHFSATAGDGFVSLVWADPQDADFAGVRVVRTTSDFPVFPTDGDVVFDGMKSAEKGGFVLDASVANDVTYYYAAFSYDTSANFAAGAFASATPTTEACFIATAAYGSPLAKDVDLFRSFRDQYLLTNVVGEKFVAFYYATSPPLADTIATHEALRVPVRMGLSVVAFILRGFMYAPNTFSILVVGLCAVYARRRGAKKWNVALYS
jgi:uncharacterized protein YegL